MRLPCAGPDGSLAKARPGFGLRRRLLREWRLKTREGYCIHPYVGRWSLAGVLYPQLQGVCAVGWRFRKCCRIDSEPCSQLRFGSLAGNLVRFGRCLGGCCGDFVCAVGNLDLPFNSAKLPSPNDKPEDANRSQDAVEPHLFFLDRIARLIFCILCIIGVWVCVHVALNISYRTWDCGLTWRRQIAGNAAVLSLIGLGLVLSSCLLFCLFGPP